MKSEQIKAKDAYTTTDVFLREIAYQLAVQNEVAEQTAKDFAEAMESEGHCINCRCGEEANIEPGEVQ